MTRNMRKIKMISLTLILMEILPYLAKEMLPIIKFQEKITKWDLKKTSKVLALL
jgi:hypothetical protein